MNQTNEEISIEFRLSSIDTKQFAVVEEIYNPELKSQIEVKASFGANPGQRVIGSHFNVRYAHEKEFFIVLEVVCYFQISHDSWEKLTISENEIRLPKFFSTHLSLITVGTTRGVLYEKLRANPNLSKFILPTIDLTKIIKGDTVIKLKERSEYD